MNLYKRSLFYWRLALFSPLTYVLICFALQRWAFESRPVPGFFPFDDAERWKLLWGASLGLLVVASGALIALYYVWWGSERMVRRYTEPEPMRDALVWRYIWLLAGGDSIALIGLVMFFIQGDIKVALMFWTLSMLTYAALHPRKLPIDKIYVDEDELDDE